MITEDAELQPQDSAMLDSDIDLYTPSEPDTSCLTPGTASNAPSESLDD